MRKWAKRSMDVHKRDYTKHCESAINRIDPRDKELIIKFYKQKCAEDVGGNRLLKILATLKSWRKFLSDKTYEQLTKDDIIETVTELNNSV